MPESNSTAEAREVFEMSWFDECPLTKEDVAKITGYLYALSVCYTKVLEIDDKELERLIKSLLDWLIDRR